MTQSAYKDNFQNVRKQLPNGKKQEVYIKQYPCNPEQFSILDEQGYKQEVAYFQKVKRFVAQSFFVNTKSLEKYDTRTLEKYTSDPLSHVFRLEGTYMYTIEQHTHHIAFWCDFTVLYEESGEIGAFHINKALHDTTVTIDTSVYEVDYPKEKAKQISITINKNAAESLRLVASRINAYTISLTQALQTKVQQSEAPLLATLQRDNIIQTEQEHYIKKLIVVENGRPQTVGEFVFDLYGYIDEVKTVEPIECMCMGLPVLFSREHLPEKQQIRITQIQWLEQVNKRIRAYKKKLITLINTLPEVNLHIFPFLKKIDQGYGQFSVDTKHLAIYPLANNAVFFLNNQKQALTFSIDDNNDIRFLDNNNESLNHFSIPQKVSSLLIFSKTVYHTFRIDSDTNILHRTSSQPSASYKKVVRIVPKIQLGNGLREKVVFSYDTDNNIIIMNTDPQHSAGRLPITKNVTGERVLHEQKKHTQTIDVEQLLEEILDSIPKGVDITPQEIIRMGKERLNHFLTDIDQQTIVRYTTRQGKTIYCTLQQEDNQRLLQRYDGLYTTIEEISHTIDADISLLQQINTIQSIPHETTITKEIKELTERVTIQPLNEQQMQEFLDGYAYTQRYLHITISLDGKEDWIDTIVDAQHKVYLDGVKKSYTYGEQNYEITLYHDTKNNKISLQRMLLPTQTTTPPSSQQKNSPIDEITSPERALFSA